MRNGWHILGSIINSRQRLSTMALDVQNVLAHKNIDGLTRDFDPDRGGWVYREQSSLVPVLSYQIDF